jgi:eukaryotic-like serine/threonine-protein kinase
VPAQQFGPYELIQRISVGGMAEVFQAMHRDTSRVVALKRILPNVAEDEEFIALFFDEARIASHLEHDNIAKILDFGQVDSSHYIALEYVDGVPLRTVLDRAASRNEPVPIEVAVGVIAEVARGLAYAHDRVDSRGRPLGIVHRDVSPQNVLVSYGGHVKLIDFGIAKAAGKMTRTQAGSIKGKMGYMAPEQVVGKGIDRRSDIFALGICLWEALTLRRLFQAQNELLVIQQIRNSEIAPPSSVNPLIPPELDRIDLKALAKDPKERYADAQEFEADLRAFARSIPAAAGAPRIAAFMARLFPAETAQRTSALQQHQESPRMSDKAGSDLDVFDGLAKKSQSVPAVPSQRPAPSVPGPPGGARQKTLLGLPAPNLPPPPSRRPSGPGPAPSGPLPPPPTPSRPPPSQARTKSLPPPISRPSAPIAPPPPTSSRQPFKAAPSHPPPPAPLPKAPPATAAPVDMDWDDEDEKTAIFDKQGNEAPATALLRSAPPPPTPSRPPTSARLGGAAALLSGSGGAAPSLPRPNLGPTQPPSSIAAPTIPASLPIPVPPRSSARGIALAVIAVLGVGLIVAVVLLALPSKGSLVVTVAGPGNKPVDSLQVLVDGAQRCQASPCRVPNLAAGTHMVRVVAAGYQQTADRAVSVEKGSEADLNLTLAPTSEGTGIRVVAKGSGLRLSVDGKDVGPLPQELKDMTPGDHVVSISGSDRYAPFEQHVTVQQNQMTTVEPKLKVIKGLARIELGDNAEGAKVLLLSGNDRRPIPKLPMNLDIATNQVWTIEATKKGYDKFEQKLTFEDGEAEKTFKINMVATSAAGTEAHHAVATHHESHETEEHTAAASGSGTLNINSIPVSNVILDGRPLGTTPKTGIHVSAGTHTVVFVQPQYGRKVRSVRVPAGGSAVAAVKFP